ncbi:MAG: hypothetical protein ACXW11_08085 [Methylotenera sp.]
MNSEEDSVVRTPDKKGVLLTERELLTSYLGAMRKDELLTLSNALKESLSNEKHEFYFEALIVSLALATGRTIEGALKLAMMVDDEEYIGSEEFENGSSVVVWVVLDKKRSLKLPLPDFIQFAISRITASIKFKALIEYFPNTQRPWSERVYEWLSTCVAGTEYSLRIKIRDALSRTLHECSVNSAILNVLVTDRQQWRRQESLSFYLDIDCKKTVEIYREANQRIFGKIGKFPPTAHKANIDLIASVIPSVSGYMCNKIIESEQDFIEYHNWFARYCLTMLIFCTGHRKSSTPFYFPWDIDLDSGFAFICDKSVVGSEARFVPISGVVAQQIKEYKVHLIDLANKVKESSPELSRLINKLGLGGDISPLTNEIEVCGHFGFFFSINRKLRANTISTKDIETSCANLGKVDVRELRSTIAQYFYLTGKSGKQIEAFLGHNSENHIFGASSTWSIKSWAIPIRLTQASYLNDMGWQLIKFSNKNDSLVTKQLFKEKPLLSLSNHSYEGRMKSREVSRLKVVKIVRSYLPEDWFYGQANLITESEIQDLREKVRAELLFDKDAQDNINFVITSEIKRIADATVTASTVNLFRTEAGPVEVSAGRNLAIATFIRAWWFAELSQFKTDKSSKALEYLVKIGISLVIFDAILDVEVWHELMYQISNKNTIFLNDLLLVHGQVTKKSKVFEKSLIPSQLTQALIIGYSREIAESDESYTVQEVNKAIQGKIYRIPNIDKSEKLNLNALMYVFRSWWLIRLPGTLYSISIGQNAGPAPDLQSELSLMGFESSEHYADFVLEKDRQKLSNFPSQCKTSPKAAIAQINALLDRAEGRFEIEGSLSKTQRYRLKEIIENFIPAELSQLADQRIIIKVFIDFIKYLLVEGGQRKDVLKFSTIRTYISSLWLLLELFWDVDLYAINVEDYRKIYESFFDLNKDKVDSSDGRIQLFHRFLRDAVDAPYCYLGVSKNNAPAECRGSLITKQAFDRAWDMVDEINAEGAEFKNAIRSYLTTGYDFGLRRKEAYGLEVSQLLINQDLGIVVKANKYRDLKSESAKRLVPNIFLRRKQKKHLSTQVNLLTLSSDGNECLFKDSSERQQLLPTSIIDKYVRALLRINTKNVDIVPHSMRHTAATRYAHFSIKAPREIPVSHKVNESLGYDDKLNLFDAFTDGYKAWPFWMDKVAIFIGHRDVDTLLDNYWHTSSIKIAEFAWHDISDKLESCNDEFLANLMGLGRSTIVNMRKRLACKSNASGSVTNEKLIQHYINLEGGKLSINHALAKADETTETELADVSVNSKGSMQWVVLDKLLLARLINGTTLSDLKNKALVIGLQDAEIDSLVEQYKGLVFDLGFYDFEPLGSELFQKNKLTNDGAIRGKIERRAALEEIQRLKESSSEFFGLLKRFVKLWVDRVNFKDPWFVARNGNELQIIQDVLLKIGVAESQLAFCSCHGFNNEQIKHLFINNTQQIQFLDKRISRGDTNAIIPEFGVRVNQKKGSKIGDGRDTHRLVFLIAIFMQL